MFRRWQVPVSIAAVLTLAIGISLHVEREKPLVVDGTPVPSGSAEYPVPQASTESADRAGVAKPSAAPVAPAAAPPAVERAVKPPPPPPEAKRIVQAPARAEVSAPAPAPVDDLEPLTGQ